MYHIFKNDMWGNKVPIMTVSRKDDADAFVERNRHIVTRVTEVPRSKSTIILM